MSSGDTTTTVASIQVNYDYQNAQRFPAWMALSVFSAICVAAVNSKSKADAKASGFGSKTSADKWILAVACVSMIVSFLSVLAYLFVRHLYVANIPEMAMTFLLLAFWGAGLPVIMNPERDIAVQGDSVVNANLYFFSWLSLGVIVYIAGHLLQEWTGLSVRDMVSANTSPKTGKWYGLAASSIVVMVSCVRIYAAEECGGDKTEYCKRTKFGISVGVLSFLGSLYLACSLAKTTMVTFQELIATTVMLTFWCFGVGFITFGFSPGSMIGNLYFSTWISFIIIVVIFGQTFRDYLSGQSQAGQQQTQNDNNNNTMEENYDQEGPPVIPADDEI